MSKRLLASIGFQMAIVSIAATITAAQSPIQQYPQHQTWQHSGQPSQVGHYYPGQHVQQSLSDNSLDSARPPEAYAQRVPPAPGFEPASQQQVETVNYIQQPHQPGYVQAASMETAANYDPIAALEAKVESLQYQLESIYADESGVYGDPGQCQGCGQCDCCQQKSRGGLYLGAAAIFAKPHYKEGFQHTQTNTQTGQQTLIPFEYDYQASIRAWLGYKAASGFGMRVTYWNFDADGQPSDNTADGINIYGAHVVSIIFPANIFAAAPGDQLLNNDSLKTQIVNYYGTYDTTVGGFEVSGGMGLRNARLKQTVSSTVLRGGQPVAQLSWDREYIGLGPAATVDARRRIGCSPFSIFASGGGSFLFGHKTLNRTVFGDQSPQPAAPFLSLTDADEVVGIGELGFGAEWSRQLPSGRNLMVRGSYEGQLWAEAGAPTLGFLGFQGFGVQVELKR